MRITADATHLTIVHPERGTYRVPRRAMVSLDAAVSERWVANVLVTATEARRLVPPRFLEPTPGPEGLHVLSLCCIFMRHAAPSWAPLAFGPGSRNCALRVACTDVRDGSEAVWVDHRYTDSTLAYAIELLGFPPVHPLLRVDTADARGLRLATTDGVLALDLRREAMTPMPLAFADADAFHAYFCAGIRSYGPGPRPGLFSVVDLEKRSPNRFARVEGLGGRLTTAAVGARGVDGLYLTRDGRYRWTHAGWCDREGQLLDRGTT